MKAAEAAGGADATTPMADRGSRTTLVLYSLTVFVSAFLLFQVQPLLGKLLLPWFGGTAGVWTACLVFFQCALLAGYAYAHGLTSRLTPRMQAVTHVVLLVTACATLPIIPGEKWKPVDGDNPALRIVLLLSAVIGLPFLALSATGPLLQRWFSQAHPQRSPYRLYALSNAGSLLALIAFPVVFERAFAAQSTAVIWSWSFAAFAVICAACAWLMVKGAPLSAIAAPIPSSLTPSISLRAFWFVLAMVPSILLLATTNQVCLDVASVPFLWIVPLILYLLSFILCFDSDFWYSRRLLMPAVGVALLCVYAAIRGIVNLPIEIQIGVYFATLFLCAMVCHGELARRRPASAHLTSFYLLVAAGGAAGGIFVGIFAPLVFKGYFELHMGLFACVVLILIALFTDRESLVFQERRWLTRCALVGMTGAYAFALWNDAQHQKAGVIASDRNFYGILRVSSGTGPFEQRSVAMTTLQNGHIVHGQEYDSPELRRLPTTYFGPNSGIGLVLGRASTKPRRVGVVGLGIGTLASYARPGDYFRFYEINPLVEPIARRYFHYLDDCRGTVELVGGDARSSMEREPSQKLDVLALDAFSGDAVPVHLLTVEALDVYLRHLNPSAILAFHVSSLNFDLCPVVNALAQARRLAHVTIRGRRTSRGEQSSVWVLLSRDPKVLPPEPRRTKNRPSDKPLILWTDSHASLLDVW